MQEEMDQGASEHFAALVAKVPPSTARYWADRAACVDAPGAYKAFFESPAGVALLHRLVVALHLVIGLMVGGGIRQVILILELAQLLPFVASSVGTHQGIAHWIEQEVVRFGRDERPRLAEQMAPKRITVCQDETFHPETCLVVIEPVSNFILAEQYVEHRDTPTWSETMTHAQEGLAVTIVQSTSDEGKGILGYARQAGAQHSPDVFHVQHDASRAISLPLARQVNDADKAVGEARAQLAQVEQQQRAWASTPHGPGRPPAFETRKEKAQGAITVALQDLEQARDRQERARTALRGLSREYHPVDLGTGAPRSAEQTTHKLQEHFETLRNVADEAQLSERSLAGLAKAERVLPAMTSTLRFVHEEVAERIAHLDMSPAMTQALTETMVPAAYLERVANRSSNAHDREKLRATAHERRTAGFAALAALGIHDEERRCAVEVEAAACADIFQRASSCVEGRNGQLSLCQHHLHLISSQRLEALTVIHNYFIRRPDGTTAAERFFAARPRDLFQYLLTRIPAPPRPACKRPRNPTLH